MSKISTRHAKLTDFACLVCWRPASRQHKPYVIENYSVKDFAGNGLAVSHVLADLESASIEYQHLKCDTMVIGYCGITNPYTRYGRIANPTEQGGEACRFICSGGFEIRQHWVLAFIMRNNIYCGIANPYTRYGRIINPTERQFSSCPSFCEPFFWLAFWRAGRELPFIVFEGKEL